MYIDALGEDYMKAFSNWIAGGANERVGTLKQKRMWGKETRRVGIEFPHFFQTELSRLENEGYTVECFPDELMDAIYLEVRDYWRFEAMMNALGLSFSQVLSYIQYTVEDYYLVAKTGTVWDDIISTRPTYEGSVIPRSFELKTPDGRNVWVHGNATEHMAEFARMKASNYLPESVRLTSQQQLRSLEAAIDAAFTNGIQYGEMLEVGGWELKFAAPREAGQLPALIHALPK